MKSNVIDGIGTIVLGGLMYIYTFSIELNRWDGESISPRFVPSLLAMIIIGLGILLIIRTLIQKKSEQPAEEKQEKSTGGQYKVWLIILSSILYLVLVRYTGFIITSIIYLFFLLRTFYSPSFLKSSIISLIATFILYLVFEYLFNIHLPKAIW